MVDDSWDISTTLNFHCTHKPHGMKPFILEDLTSEQKAKLNVRKREQIRADQKYLAKHPEIKGIIVMILRILMKTKPKYNIQDVIGKYFVQPSVDIKEEVYSYLRDRGKVVSVTSAMKVGSEEESDSQDFNEGCDNEDLKEAEEKIQQMMEHKPHIVHSKETLEDKSICSSEKIAKDVINEILERINIQDDHDNSSDDTTGSSESLFDYQGHAIESLSSDSDSHD